VPLLLGALVLALVACTGERPSLRASETTGPSVLGTSVEREVERTPGARPFRVTTTTAAPTTTAPPVTTATTAAPTTTTRPAVSSVTGTYQARAEGADVDIALERPDGATVATRSATAGASPVAFSFGGLSAGSYRVSITDTYTDEAGSSVSVVRSVVFELDAGESANVECTPDECTTAL
jgi:hypothetical protein